MAQDSFYLPLPRFFCEKRQRETPRSIAFMSYLIQKQCDCHYTVFCIYVLGLQYITELKRRPQPRISVC